MLAGTTLPRTSMQTFPLEFFETISTVDSVAFMGSILYLRSIVNNKQLNKWCRHTFISICVNFLKNKLNNRNNKNKNSKAQIYLICKIGCSDKRKYQRNCAFSVQRKSTAWNKRKYKTMALDTQANLAESHNGSFCNQRKWSEFYYGEFINYY